MEKKLANTRELADVAVKRLQEYSWGRSDVHVHWDDCDMDERRFWIHISVDGIRKLGLRDDKSTLVWDISRKLQKVCRKFKKDFESMYEVHFFRESSPKRRYRRYFDHYDHAFLGYSSDTWVYVLTFYG